MSSITGHYFSEQRHDYYLPHVFRVQYCRNHLRYRTHVIDTYFPRFPNNKSRHDLDCSEKNGFDNSADDTVFDHDCREARHNSRDLALLLHSNDIRILILYHNIIIGCCSEEFKNVVIMIKKYISIMSAILMISFGVVQIIIPDIRDNRVLWEFFCVVEVFAVLLLGSLDVVDVYVFGHLIGIE